MAAVRGVRCSFPQHKAVCLCLECLWIEGNTLSPDLFYFKGETIRINKGKARVERNAGYKDLAAMEFLGGRQLGT
jgi:hypothetical protein